MKVLDIINEMLSPEEYHSTGIMNLLRIIQTDTLNLSSGIAGRADDMQKKMFFLSLSRTGSPKLGYGQKGDRFCRIVFNGSKLNQNYQSQPVDYWANKVINPSGFEYEDRLVTDKSTIDNVSKYIIRIDIMITKDMPVTSLHIIKEIVKLCDSKNVPVFVYENSNDLVKKVNQVNDKVLAMDTQDIPDDSKWEGHRLDLNRIVALLMFDRKYSGNEGYNLFKEDLQKFLEDNDLPKLDEFKVYDIMRELFYDSRDFLPSISSSLHNYLKGGYSANPKDRKYLDLLVREMRKYKVRNIPDFINIKTKNLKPEGPFVDYRGKIGLYRLHYNHNTMKWDEWKMVPYDRDLEKLGLYLNVGRYGGYLSDEDMNMLFDMRSQGKTWGDYMNYLLNRYTTNEVVRIINKSGYSDYEKRHEFKLDKV